MSTPLSLVAQGHYTSDGAARTIEFPCPIDYFVVRDRTLWGTAPTAVVQATWYRGYAAGQSTSITEGGGSALTATSTAAGGLGFTEVDYTSLTTGLVATGTAITAANPAVVSDAATPRVGDVVRMVNTTGMLNIAGIDFTVTAVTAGVNFTLGYLDTSNLAVFAAATNADYRIINKRFAPRRRTILAITAANPAVISTSTAHGYVVGSRITIYNPDAHFGMPEIHGLNATVTAVTANTITTDINAAGFTAFLYPTSAIAAAGVTFPHVVPRGEVSTILTQAFNNTLLSGLFLDTGVVGTNNSVMDWLAFSRDYTI